MPGRSRRERLEDLPAGGQARLERARSRSLVERGALTGGDVTAAAAGPAVDDVPESVRWSGDLLHRWRPAGYARPAAAQAPGDHR